MRQAEEQAGVDAGHDRDLARGRDGDQMAEKEGSDEEWASH